jgi:hypothetical protein
VEIGKLARNMAVSGVCLTVKCWLNLYLIKEYGEMLKLEIDSENRTMNVEVLLKGESAPIRIHVGRYDCVTGNGNSGVVLQEISTSREWMNSLITNLHPDGLTIPMDEQIVSIAKGVL